MGRGPENMPDNAADIILCSQCGAKNRIAANRTGSIAKCGRCHAPLPVDQAKSTATTHILRCSQCGTKNRVQLSGHANHPKCGKCKADLRIEDLRITEAVMVSDSNFPETVMKSSLPMLVYAMSPSCPSCSLVSPQVEALARELRGRIRVGKLNVQLNPLLASRFNILGVPTFLIFDRGELLESLPGTPDRRQLTQIMSKYLY
jgi:thioredoxin 2